MAIIYGVNPVLEQLLTEADKIEQLHLLKGPLKGALGRIARQSRDLGLHIIYVDRKTLNRIAQGGNHQGVVARISEYEYPPFAKILETIRPDDRVVILDGVQDPHNLGAIVRTAACAGVKCVIIPERNAVGMTAAAIKSSAGASSHLPVVRVKNLNRAIEALKGKKLWVVAIEANGEKTVAELDKTIGYAFVFGSEGKGIRKLVRANCDLSANIPMKGGVNSLNVSVSVGVVLYSVFES